MHFVPTTIPHCIHWFLSDHLSDLPSTWMSDRLGTESFNSVGFLFSRSQFFLFAFHAYLLLLLHSFTYVLYFLQHFLFTQSANS